MQKLIYIFIFSLLIVGRINSQTCVNLPNKFYSYSQAIRSIKTSTFKSIDNLPPGKSSWIVRAAYYSCDDVTGYLVYTTDKGKEYVHEKIPIRVWIEFKTASSSGSYYVRNIRGGYRLVPE